MVRLNVHIFLRTYSFIGIAPLAAHLETENVEFMQFAFRWMNCLLMREISVQNTIRMWDTYLVRLNTESLKCVRAHATNRRKEQTHSRNSTCMSVPLSW